VAQLEVGVGIWSLQSTKAGPRHFSYLYKELMEDAAFCDELTTIKTIWQTEHHFWYDGYCPSLLTVAGGIAAATKRIRIGQAALLFSQHEALRVAQQAAVVDQLSAGAWISGWRWAIATTSSTGSTSTAGLGAVGSKRAWRLYVVRSPTDPSTSKAAGSRCRMSR